VRRRTLLAGAAALLAGPVRAQAGGEVLIRGAHILTMDPALGDLTGDIHVRDGAIVAVAASVQAASAQTIDGAGMVALPGIVDTHWHMWNSLLRGLVGGTPPTGYFPTIQKYGPYYTPQHTYAATRLALAEAVNAGVTTVHNWAHNTRDPGHARASLRAHEDSRARARFGYGSPQGLAPDKLQDLADMAKIRDELPKLVRLGAALRGPQMSALATSRAEFEAARKLGLPISVHMTGNAEASEKFKVIQTLDRDSFLGPDVQVIHAVHATPQDIETLVRTRAHVSVSPYAESAGMGVAPVNAFRKAGVLVSLSIDNTALPASVDPFALMRQLIILLQARDGLASPFGARQALEMATRDGARALGLEAEIGTLTPGKRADLILVRTGDLNLTAAGDREIDRLLMAAQPVNVDSVMVEGRFLKRGGKLVDADAGAIVQSARESIEALRRRAG
jgi:cytosine/adenosine deaminase-related metal-dependent hydrolase